MDKFEVKLDQAARAAWMSYVGGMTQDEIATQLGVSRPGVQRLLALARQEGLVKVHIDHPISTCMALGSALRERFLLPAPVVAESLAEKEAMLSQRLFKAIADVARWWTARSPGA
ncbi:hypothetical protein AWR38_14010 [Idiomarina sp. WRN-38]|jgi:DNA-binding transcriptional regulator LsrR (DeoR family)|uniref:sigma factor-like helix-turn-helix DNA-binding protein n=1 Tax=Halomonadaceae TaxID=28256 RepID=UPI00073357C4|nr:MULTISPECIES: sigma factor-like helix-turn-helix DNA-binding protein [Halomonas]KTG28132.1 hypothetical protein AUR68_13995 [Idiomarina sp. H105]MEC9295370.1 sigma factor-like helix-turn-helix DNA-binding protein [Pseudomonadota bacterium]OAF07145.1 hypothetical protein AWR38_14010 [Idiomarina sp. WRN-38]MCP1302871.1 MarR family transcriptional regulator [Halomonas sp. R1t8]MCP1330199.1 MarR family transcriptional regulator [Halomonas sp. R1t4]|tara:strand:+ start:503 stop:847 length:345 start_codon:yes stop_codon:yes gene_type:complete